MYQLRVPLILASGSPRRKELLADCGFEFKICTSDFDETVSENEDPKELVLRLAEGKAKSVALKFPDDYILAADTDVALGSKIFGKPQDFAEVTSMLKMLSGTTHQVFGGIVLWNPNLQKIHSALSATSVTFRTLSNAETEAYASTREPYDKAGAYAAQGLGASFIEKIEGSYTNVVGLDLAMVLGLFREADILIETL